MKIEIRKGEIIDSTPLIDWREKNFDDDMTIQKKKIYDCFNFDDVIITNVDYNLLFALNNCFLAYKTRHKTRYEDVSWEWQEDHPHLIPINPSEVNVVMILDNGEEISLMKEEEGDMERAYFDKLLGLLWNDFYWYLDFYDQECEDKYKEELKQNGN